MKLSDILSQAKQGWQEMFKNIGYNDQQGNGLSIAPRPAQNYPQQAINQPPQPDPVVINGGVSYPQVAEVQPPQPDLVQGDYRNPQMEQFRQQNPQDFNEILSAAQLATEDSLKRQLLMDLALEESGMRVNPPPNPNSSASGAYQYIDSTANQMGIDPINATASAKATSNALDNGNLGWWDVLHNGGATNTPLTNLYSKEELARFLK